MNNKIYELGKTFNKFVTEKTKITVFTLTVQLKSRNVTTFHCFQLSKANYIDLKILLINSSNQN